MEVQKTVPADNTAVIGPPITEPAKCRWFNETKCLTLILQLLIILSFLFVLGARGAPGQDAEEFVAEGIAAAQSGDPQSMIFLAVMYEAGIAVRPDPVEAFYWSQAAADTHDREGLMLVGRAYAEGRGVGRDEERALYWFSEAAQDLLRGFSLDKTSQFGGTAESLLQAAESRRGRHDLAKAWAGMMYLTGDGVEPSDTEAVRWLKKSLEEEHLYAVQLLGLMYQEGRGGLPKDTEEALRLYRKAADEAFEGTRSTLAFTCLYVTGQPDCSEAPTDSKESVLAGSVSGDTYSSPRGLFSVRIPEPANWAGAPYEIRDSFETGRPNYDVVVMVVHDFGEVLLAGVRKIPDDVLAKQAIDDPRTVLDNLAHKVLYDWRNDFAGMANVIEDSFVQTQFGEAILRVYSAQKGSLMTRGEGNRSPEPFYTEVIVLLAKRDNHLICAIDEYDGTLLDGESRTSESKARIQRFFSGLTVPLNPAFHEK